MTRMPAKRPRARRAAPLFLAWSLVLVTILGCSAAKELLALRRVEFRFTGLSGARVAGIPLRSLRSYSDLSPIDLGRLGVAIAREDVPLDLTVHVEGKNPETNDVTARMVALGWSYLVDDREVISGRLADERTFPPGEPRDVPLFVTFNLMDLAGSRQRDLFEVALALAGQRASTHKVSMRLTPTIETPLGRMQYPVPITLDLSAPNQE